MTDVPLFHAPSGPPEPRPLGAAPRPARTAEVDAAELRTLRRRSAQLDQAKARVRTLEGDLRRARDANRLLRERVAQLTGAKPSAADLARRELAARYPEEFARLRRQLARGGDANDPQG